MESEKRKKARALFFRGAAIGKGVERNIHHRDEKVRKNKIEDGRTFSLYMRMS